MATRIPTPPFLTLPPQHLPCASTPLAGTQIGGLLDTSPNPFNSAVEIRLNMPGAGLVELSVYDLTGRKVDVLARGVFPSGTLRRTWHPEGPSGIYLIRAVSPAGVEVKKLLYLK